MTKHIIQLILILIIFSVTIYYKSHKPPISSDAYARMDEIVKGINKTYGGPMCIMDGPFPMHFDTKNNISGVCLHCKELLNANLIEKNYPQNFGDESLVDLALTELGEQYYTQSVKSTDIPGFCFGNISLDKVIAALPALNMYNSEMISVKFKLKAQMDGDFLSSPEAKKLGYPYLPFNKDGSSDKIITETIQFDNGKFGSIAYDLRYGDWVNEK